MRLLCKDVAYRYDQHKRSVLNGIHFSTEPGMFWGILGPNGAGKSTFLKLVSGLLPKQGFVSGQVLWNNKKLQDYSVRELAQKVAYVPSVLKNNFSVSMRDFILQGRFSQQKIWQKPHAADFKKVDEALEYFDIQGLGTAFLDQVSSGELQLALLARAFVQDPEVLILDESMSGVDFSRLANVFRRLIAWNKQKKLTILWATHDLNLAAEVCDQFAWLVEGKITLSGPVTQAFSPAQLNAVFGDSLVVAQSPKTQKPQVFLKI